MTDAHGALLEAEASLLGILALLEENQGIVTLPAFALMQLLQPVRERVSAARTAVEAAPPEGAVQVVVTGNGRAP